MKKSQEDKKTGRSICEGSIRWLVCFFVTLGSLFLLLFLAVSIPKYKIREHLLETANYLLEEESLFYQQKEGDRKTEIHNYADATTLNILYSIDGKDRVKELLQASFYSNRANQKQTMTELLVDRIVFERRADTLYDRYWHGMILFLRPLLLFFPLQQIRYIFLGAMLASMLVLTGLLVKKEQWILAVLLWLGAILVQFPVAAFCIEYFPVFFITFLVSGFMIGWEENRERVLDLCVISGVCVAFFDFLTTETLTFVIPMALLYGVWEGKGKLKSIKEEFFFVIRAGISWLCAYLGSYLVRWSLGSIVCGEERFSVALKQFAGRQGNEITNFAIDSLSENGIPLEAMKNAGGEILPQCISSVMINLRLLLGLSGKISLEKLAFLLLVFLMVCAAVIYLFRKPGTVGALPVVLVLLGVIPIVRMMLLNNHSIEHCFFVYRSFYGTILCFWAGVIKMFDWEFLRRRKKYGVTRVKKS